MYCSNCGKEIQEGIKFCPECGSPTGFAHSAQEEAKPINGSPESVADAGSIETEKAEIIQEESTAAETENAVETPDQSKGVTLGQSTNSASQSVIENATAPVYNYGANPIQKSSGQESFAVSQNGQIKNGKIKFKDLPPKKKALRLGIGGILILIGLIWIISDGIGGAKKSGDYYSANPSYEENDSNQAKNIVKSSSISETGYVCFNTTIDEFIKDYNDHIAIIYNNNETYQKAGQSYIDSLIDMNSLKISDFEIYNKELEEGSTSTVYKLNFNNIGIGIKRGSAGLYVYTEPSTKQILALDYLVSEDLLNASSEAEDHWLYEISACIFAGFTDYNWSESFNYSDGVVCIELFGSVDRVDHLIVCAATEDSYYYDLYSNM